MTRMNLFIAAVWMLSMCSITLAQDRGSASSIAWSPDGATIAVASTTGLWLFDNQFHELGHVEIKQTDREQTRYVEWNAAGDLIAISSLWFGPIRVVDVKKLEVINEIEFSMLKTPVLWHPSEDQILGGSEFGETRILDAVTGEELFYFSNREAWPDMDPMWLGTVGLCWNSENTIVILNNLSSYVVDLVANGTPELFVEDLGRLGAVCSHEYKIINGEGKLYDIQSGTPTQIFDEYVDFAVAQAWSPISRHFVVSLRGCLTRVYDGDTGDLVAELPGGVHGLGAGLWDFTDSIAWHPDGSRFAIVGQFGDIRVWDAKTYELLQRTAGFELHPELVSHLDYPEQLSELECP